MKKYAVVVAGGTGQRMGAKIPKQFLLLKGRPVLYYTLHTFLQAFPDLEIILVLPEENLQQGAELVEQMNMTSRIKITGGGESRFYSVRKGLALVSHPSIVFVHDGVRCLLSENLVRACYQQALTKGSAIPAIVATDSIRIDDGVSHSSYDRNKIKIIQTPQTFQSHLISKAYEQDYNPSFTDEATVVEATGESVFLIEGEHSNLKITRPIDLCIAEKLLEGNIF